MTSNEQKILECIRTYGGKARIGFLGSKTGFSSDYSRFLCRTLKRSGHLEFVETNVCHLLTKGCSHFQRNDELVHEEWLEAPQVILALSALISSENGRDSGNKEDVKNGDESSEQAVNLHTVPEEMASSGSLLHENDDAILPQAPVHGLLSAGVNDSDLDRGLASIEIRAKGVIDVESVLPLTGLADLSSASGQGEESKKEEEKEEGQKKGEEEKREGIDTGAVGLAVEFEDEAKTVESGKRVFEEVEENSLPEAKKEVTLDDIKDAIPQEKEKSAEAGYKSAKDLVKTPINRLIQGIGVSLEKVANWINQARHRDRDN